MLFIIFSKSLLTMEVGHSLPKILFYIVKLKGMYLLFILLSIVADFNFTGSELKIFGIIGNLWLNMVVCSRDTKE